MVVSNRGSSKIATDVQSRKARRKEERAQKKNKKNRKRGRQPHHQHGGSGNDYDDEVEGNGGIRKSPSPPRGSKRRKKLNHSEPAASASSSGGKGEKERRGAARSGSKKRKTTKNGEDDPYAGLDPDVAAAMRRDDEEIAALEANLGISPKKSKKNKEKDRLKREYARLEGYGDDFGDFLDDLDNLVGRVSGGGGPASDADAGGLDTTNHLRSGTAAAATSDSDDGFDGESSSDDDRLDGIFGGGGDDEDASDDDEDEILPMKDPAYDDEMEEDDSVMDEIEAEEERGDRRRKNAAADVDDNARGNGEESSSSSQDVSDSGSEEEDSDSDEDEDDAEIEKDHDSSVTYRPTKGEDIYGNQLGNGQSSSKLSKYVPPHMRNKQQRPNMPSEDDDESGAAERAENDKRREESLREIQKLLNSALNRLSEDTLVSVSQSIARLYSSYPSWDVNECVWRHTRKGCVSNAVQMTALIPVYVAALAGVHVQRGDAAQLGEYVVEVAVLDLWRVLRTARRDKSEQPSAEAGETVVSKEASNLMLLICYLYNFNIVHCTLVYSIVRELVNHFDEIDVEMLLLILSHSGRALRSDDPSSLKEIVLLVQKRALEVESSGGMAASANSSRVDFMVSAMMDLKNNKKRKQDVVYAERTAKLRKMVGKIKSTVAAGSSNVRSSDSSLRIALNDILDAETKGRWWKVGASWVGNQYRYQQGDGSSNRGNEASSSKASETKLSSSAPTNGEDEKLLKLAAKYRMNTDTRRSIFCIVMGSADCDDSFEKLARAGMLKNRTERETVRVLMECCGNEKNYNRYYSHLASRICEFQPQCKFTFQLAYWDVFKQFDVLKVRKAANLAKLLFHLVAIQRHLKLDVLKAIDMSSPDELPETAMIFLTIFFSSVLEQFDDQGAVSGLFKDGITHRKASRSEDSADDDLIGHVDEGEALRANMTVFFVQVLKSSPKYKKGSKFRSNLKAAIRACDTDNFFME